VFDWLFEGRPFVYVILGAAAVVLLALWWRTRKRHYLFAVGGVAALAAVYLLLSVVKETDSRQVNRKLQEMADGVNGNNLDRSFSHISDSFQLSGMNKSAFRQRANDAMQRHQVRDMVIWDVLIEELSREARSARVAFRVKAHASGAADEAHFLCRSQWVLDPDGQWRLQSFQLFHPFVNTEQPISLPF
jgi:hypothetical protein